ncbi:MAG: hypothetical protein CVU11_16650 [Bacteroidetes bacterium HGW-Bacteroidetes-6]|jgi:hypothetical protein|nr:MAG: hypothetical protein CVU11_16650 [Bacteroidetes bacterium HGW-Bacteroidetes-6]
MKKTVLFIIVVTLNLSTQAQDWCSWSFQYDFKITSNNRGEYKFDSLEITINDEFASTRLQRSVLEYNDSTKLYSVYLDYGCVSCGYADAKHPPATYLKLYMYDDFRNQNISIIIPITFDEINDFGELQKIEPGKNPPYPVYFDLGTIYYEDFIFFNSTFEKYEGIIVKSDGKVSKYKEGEYQFPPTKKLIEIKPPTKNKPH